MGEYPQRFSRRGFLPGSSSFAALHSVTSVLPLRPSAQPSRSYTPTNNSNNERRNTLSCPHGSGRVRTVKLTSTGGTTHPCNDGHPGSLVELRHNDAVASLI